MVHDLVCLPLLILYLIFIIIFLLKWRSILHRVGLSVTVFYQFSVIRLSFSFFKHVPAICLHPLRVLLKTREPVRAPKRCTKWTLSSLCLDSRDGTKKNTLLKVSDTRSKNKIICIAAQWLLWGGWSLCYRRPPLFRLVRRYHLKKNSLLSNAKECD